MSDTNIGLISVIIPAYNVEKYLNRCLDSLTEQNYKNLEIIIIDDGSSDRTGEICDVWKEKDDRIIVIHQENAGLSAARNSGLKIAKGDYIAFVDSDDWTRPEMYERLVLAIEQSDADMACCGMIESDGEHEKKLNWFAESRLLDLGEAMDYLVDNSILTSHVMPKLYKREIWENLEYPVGKTFEDIRIMHKVFEKCRKIQIVGGSYYYYYSRPGSISKSRNLKTYVSWMEGLLARREDLKMNPLYYSQLTAKVLVIYSLAVIQENATKELKTSENQTLHKCNQELHSGREVLRWCRTYASKKDYIYVLMARYASKTGNRVYRFLKNLAG